VKTMLELTSQRVQEIDDQKRMAQAVLQPAARLRMVASEALG
jgi:hypothetical protein